MSVIVTIWFMADPEKFEIGPILAEAGVTMEPQCASARPRLAGKVGWGA